MKESSTEALEFFRSAHGEIDMVLTDQTMPQLTGLELAKELRAIRHDIPIILCTGFADQMIRIKADALGISVTPKPFSLVDLIAKIRADLRRYAAVTSGDK